MQLAPRGEVFPKEDCSPLRSVFNLTPRGEVGPQGWSWLSRAEELLFAPLFSKTIECSPLGVTKWVNGESSPQGANFTQFKFRANKSDSLEEKGL
jgi:hypothetical protein